ncbi:MAG: hypothetical protein FVQ77_01025 [Cytophagales bacterium]|nr:hypothetical protein [Cytophagales bacterium]
MKLNLFNRTIIRKLVTATIISLATSVNIFAQLSGTYTIGINPTDSFASFTEAVDTLISQGVGGPVIFNVQNGTYNEQFEIPVITNVNATNTITFQSLSGDSTAVTLSYGSSTSGDNYVVKLNGANFINFHQLTITNTGTSFSFVFYFLGGASNDTISNCVLIGPNTTNTSINLSVIYGYGSQDQNNVIKNNLIVNGSYGIHLRGTSTSVLSAGNEIINNQFVNNSYYGVMVRHQNAPKIINNNINMSNSSSLGYGIYTAYSDNNMEIQKNKINMTNGGYGIYLFNSDGSFILKGSVANNFIYIGGTGTSYGIFSNGSTYQNIFHNSVNVLGSSTGGRAFYASGGSNLDVRNNCFKNSGWGYAYYTNSLTNIDTSDYNNYYGSGNYLANWGGNVEDLIALKVVNGKDVNSISVKPVYTSNTDLHTTIFTLDGKGDPTTGITTDIDGDARAGTPDIGADEFVGVGTPLAGIYTVGGVTPDFVTVSAAVDSLNDVGISASVTFDIRDGSYSEQFQVYPVTGADATKTVTFQSENRDSSLVDINFNASSTNQYIFRLRAADYITIRDLTISANGVNNAIAIRISGNPKFDSIYNCVINSNTNISSVAALHGNSSLFNNIVVQNSLFNSGYWGIYMNANNAILATGIEVSNNVFSGQTDISIYLEDQDASIITNNNITATGSFGYNGIYLFNVENDFVLTGNTITSSNGSDGGIRVHNCTGTNSKKGLVANNFVNIGGNTTAYGIYTLSSDFVNIYYNSVQITSTNSTAGRAYNNSNGANIDVRNNIFANFGGLCLL